MDNVVCEILGAGVAANCAVRPRGIELRREDPQEVVGPPANSGSPECRAEASSPIGREQFVNPSIHLGVLARASANDRWANQNRAPTPLRLSDQLTTVGLHGGGEGEIAGMQ
jgi:hypothetical protein